MDRVGQAALLYGAGGLIFGLIFAPLPNIASNYVLSGVLDQMDGYYSQHQSAVEGFKMTVNTSGPNYYITEDHITDEIDTGPCNNTNNFETRFTGDIFSDCSQNHNTGGSGYPNTYSMYNNLPAITGYPRISFYNVNSDQGGLNTLMVDGKNFRRKIEDSP